MIAGAEVLALISRPIYSHLSMCDESKVKQFAGQLTRSLVELEDFVNFERVQKGVDKTTQHHLKLLEEYLLGQEDLEQAVEKLWTKDPEAFKVLGRFIAVRKDRDPDIYVPKGEEPNPLAEELELWHGGSTVPMSDYFSSPKLVYAYLEQTGLKALFQSEYITCLTSYLWGLEVGLDTYARSGRIGQKMTQRVEKAFARGGISTYQKEVKSESILDLQDLKTARKRFDFVVKTRRMTYLIEVNFYNTRGGRSLDVGRSYPAISEEINSLEGFEFVWITDGLGWLDANGELREDFVRAIKGVKHVYNLQTLDKFVDELAREGVIDLDEQLVKE